MKRKDPVLDSEAFTRALTHVLLEDKLAYKLIVQFLFYGLTVEACAKECGCSAPHASKLLGKAKDLIREFLRLEQPELLDLPALINGSLERLAQREVDEVNERFPFVKPGRIV